MNEVIRDPEKNPTSEDLESLKPHPSLIQALEALEENVAIDPQLLEDDDDIELRLERTEEEIIALSDDSEQEEILSNDDNSIASVDSIARNADFVFL